MKTTFTHSQIEPMARRHETGRQSLIDAISKAGKLNAADAEMVANVYLKERIAKLSINIGQFSIKHGAFLNEDVIRNALDHAKPR